MNINVTVENKTVTAPRDAVIVCGNADYTITFNFDEEWRSESKKTARFVWFRGNKSVVEETEFTGSVAAVPILSNTRAVFVGVYAGSLRTTTAAKIECEPSILCYGSNPAKMDDTAMAKLQGLVDKLLRKSLSKEDIEKIIDERLGGIQGGGGSGGNVENGIPPGGKTGQYLCKQSDDDYDVIWADLVIPERYGLVTYDQDKTITIT